MVHWSHFRNRVLAVPYAILVSIF